MWSTIWPWGLLETFGKKIVLEISGRRKRCVSFSHENPLPSYKILDTDTVSMRNGRGGDHIQITALATSLDSVFVSGYIGPMTDFSRSQCYSVAENPERSTLSAVPELWGRYRELDRGAVDDVDGS